MLKPSGGVLKKIFAPGRVKSATTSAASSATPRPATAKPSNDFRGKKEGIFGKMRKA